MLFIWLKISKCSFNRGLEKTKQVWNSIRRIEQSHHNMTIKHNNQSILILFHGSPGSDQGVWAERVDFLNFYLWFDLSLITTVTRRHFQTFLVFAISIPFVSVIVMSSYSWVPPKLVGLFEGYVSPSGMQFHSFRAVLAI